MHASITTIRPPASARAAASSLTMPVCSHSAFAPIVTASSAIAGVSSARRNTSTMSIALGDVDQRRIRSLSEDLGLLRVDRDRRGSRRVCSFCMMPCDALSGFDDAPTIAMVVASVRSSLQIVIGRVRVRHPQLHSSINPRSCSCRARAWACGCTTRCRVRLRAPRAPPISSSRAPSVWTGNSLQPDAKAVAVIGDRIVDVGGAADIERWSRRETTVVDAAGRRLVPGFNDAGVGFADGGAALDHVDLQDAASAAEFARRIDERAKAKPGEWVLGGRMG